MTDQELRKRILGRWTCEDKWVPHRVEFRPDGTITIIMSTGNLLGGVIGFFSGEKCDGTWAIHDRILRISFDRVPDSWLNQNLSIAGFGFRLPLGDMVAKIYSNIYGAMQVTRLNIDNIGEDEMVLQPFRGSGDTFRWTRYAE